MFWVRTRGSGKGFGWGEEVDVALLCQQCALGYGSRCVGRWLAPAHQELWSSDILDGHLEILPIWIELHRPVPKLSVAAA